MDSPRWTGLDDWGFQSESSGELQTWQPATTIYGQRASLARHGTGPCQHGPIANGPARHAVPHWAAGLAFGTGTALWADFRAGPAREARPESRTVPSRGLLPFAFTVSQTDNSSQFHNSYIHSSHHHSFIHSQNQSPKLVRYSHIFIQSQFIHSLIHRIKVQSRQTTEITKMSCLVQCYDKHNVDVKMI